MYDAIFRVDRERATDDDVNGVESADVFRPAERLSFAQALWTYTVGAAYACQCENVLGQLKESFAADFLIVDLSVADNHKLLKDLTPDVVVVGGQIKGVCEEILDKETEGGRGFGRGIRVFYPRHLAGEIDGDDIHLAEYHRNKRARRQPTQLSGNFIPGKNGPSGLMSRKRDESKGIRARSSVPTNGFFCACWLRGKMCMQAKHNSKRPEQKKLLPPPSNPLGDGMLCLPVSALADDSKKY